MNVILYCFLDVAREEAAPRRQISGAWQFQPSPVIHDAAEMLVCAAFDALEDVYRPRERHVTDKAHGDDDPQMREHRRTIFTPAQYMMALLSLAMYTPAA